MDLAWPRRMRSMRRWMLSLVILASTVAAREANAGGRNYPRRYERGTYSQYVLKKRHGQPVVSQTYNGYDRGFPPPAFLYYGYPHSGDMTGIGPLDRK